MFSIDELTRAKKQSLTEYLGKKIVFIDGSNISISVASADHNDINVTISLSGFTPTPNFYESAPPANSGSGGTGSDSLISHGNHYHPAVSSMLRTAYNYSADTGNITTWDVTTGWTPFLWITDCYVSNKVQIGVAIGTGGSLLYSMHQWDSGLTSGASIAYPLERGDGTQWTVTEWSTTRVRVGGSTERFYNIGSFVLGSV